MAIVYNGPPLLYHYTTVAGLDGILRSRELWATDLRFLNDSEEYLYTVNLVLAEVERQRESSTDPLDIAELDALGHMVRGEEEVIPSVFVFSMSANGDQLSQWRGYGKGGGFALGFNAEQLQECASGWTLVRCEYGMDQQLAAVAGLVEHARGLMRAGRTAERPSTPKWILGGGRYVREIQPRLINLAARLKAPGFVEEAESRLVLFPGSAATKLHVRAGGAALIPYTTIGIGGPPPDPQVAQYQLRSMRLVTIGPSVHGERMLRASVQSAFAANGVHYVLTQTSETPYRASV